MKPIYVVFEGEKMGQITISFNGSFCSTKTARDTFKGYSASAQAFGHASAVETAIGYLTEIALPDAIKLDVKLDNQGLKPNRGFGATVTEEIKRRDNE